MGELDFHDFFSEISCHWQIIFYFSDDWLHCIRHLSGLLWDEENNKHGSMCTFKGAVCYKIMIKYKKKAPSVPWRFLVLRPDCTLSDFHQGAPGWWRPRTTIPFPSWTSPVLILSTHPPGFFGWYTDTWHTDALAISVIASTGDTGKLLTIISFRTCPKRNNLLECHKKSKMNSDFKNIINLNKWWR